MVSCQWVSDKYRGNYNNILPHLEEQRFLKPHIIFKGRDIKCKYKTKLLGLHLTEDIKRDVRIKHTNCQLNRSYYVMQSFNGKTSVRSKKYVFCDFPSHLGYGILFCGGDGESKNNF